MDYLEIFKSKEWVEFTFEYDDGRKTICKNTYYIYTATYDKNGRFMAGGRSTLTFDCLIETLFGLGQWKTLTRGRSGVPVKISYKREYASAMEEDSAMNEDSDIVSALARMLSERF